MSVDPAVLYLFMFFQLSDPRPPPEDYFRFPGEDYAELEEERWDKHITWLKNLPLSYPITEETRWFWVTESEGYKESWRLVGSLQWHPYKVNSLNNDLRDRLERLRRHLGEGSYYRGLVAPCSAPFIQPCSSKEN